MEQTVALTRFEYDVLAKVLEKPVIDERDAAFIMNLLRKLGIITNAKKFMVFKSESNTPPGFSERIVVVTSLATIEIMASYFKDHMLLMVEVSRGRRSWIMHVVVQCIGSSAGRMKGRGVIDEPEEVTI